MKNIFIAAFIFLFGMYFLTALTAQPGGNLQDKPISALLKDIEDDRIKEVTVTSSRIIATYKDGKEFAVNKEPGSSFVDTLISAGIEPQKVPITIDNRETSTILLTFLANLIPTLLLVAFFIFLFRQARGAQESVFSFGQSKAKLFNKDLPKNTFKDVAGVDEAKGELEEVVDFLKNPDKYKKIGARTPKGVLLVGPAGCGKTLLAKAVAGEANVPFFSIAGSEFMEMLVGIGAARVRDLFGTAKKAAPAIIFIDEIDAVGRARSVGMMPSHDEREQTLNQILVEMDGFSPNERVIVIAATNRGDLLDSALLRPGRFDRRILVDYPELAGRKEILEIHKKGKPFEADVDWDRVARRTVGYSGADLENMLNEAAILAARKKSESISMDDLEEAATKVKLGPEKKRFQSEYDRKLTAYHEAGHALVSHVMPHTDPVHRISIVSRGMALGYTLIPPVKDKLHETKTNLLERMAVMMGGRAAEEVVFGEITTGASNDFDQATSIARKMVVEFGMSRLGPVNFGPTNDITRYGSWEQNGISEATMAKIDVEVQSILHDAYDKAINAIKANRKALDTVAEELLKKENMDSAEFEKIVGEKIGGLAEGETAKPVEKKDTKKEPEAKS